MITFFFRFFLFLHCSYPTVRHACAYVWSCAFVIPDRHVIEMREVRFAVPRYVCHIPAVILEPKRRGRKECVPGVRRSFVDMQRDEEIMSPHS